MARGRSDTVLDTYLRDMMLAVESGSVHSALALALALPDICGTIEYPTMPKVVDRYTRWCDDWGKILVVTPADCYAIRCAYLHSGSEEFSGSSTAKAIFSRVNFTVGQVGGGWASRAVQSATLTGKPIVETPVEQFCRDMATSVDAWLRARSGDTGIAAEVAALLCVRPAGP